ncbi:MAG TPA: sulfotransferase [Acidimicrobiia bacterium]|nr:sulfotransferase [Acidimicrobiia bacterium]
MMRAVEPFAAELVLEPEPLCEQAAAETGLSDFGDDAFRERLTVLTGALRDEAGLGPMGVVSAHGQLVKLLKNRLLVEDRVAQHPEILELAVSAPIVIAGQPRTGTTHLHNLLAADPALRSLPYWESLEPVLPAAERDEVAAGAPDPRRARTEEGLVFLNEALPYFKRMHEMTVDHVHEEIQLLAIDFSTMLFETMAVMPTWRDYYLAHDQVPSYRYLKRVLQVLQWERGGTRWVLKSPQHLEQFGSLVEVFPDATFVVSHRDPVSVIASNCTMLAYTARLNAGVPDPKRIGRYWSDRIQQMLEAGMRDRALLPAERSLDVRFHEFMADDLATVRRIYAVADQPFGADVEAAMTRFVAEHPRGRHGGVRYDLAGDFGIDPAALRAAMREYVTHFGVEEER